MAPAKRRRTIEDDGDATRLSDHEEIIDVQEARSELRKGKSKRSRVSASRVIGTTGDSDDRSDVDSAYGERAERDFDHEEDDEERAESDIESDVERDFREDIEEQMKGGKTNVASDHGVIEEVFCRNFMCHSKLRIKLGPLINFIIGHNGSGKSAVLTALTLCLGVKATTTNRGASLKNFIKEGQESAMLSVKIKNHGDLAYQPELYGDSIIVERHFNRAGASQFKIKSAEERIITTKKTDLEDMLDYLGLQLDNPLNVLSQDLARQFLSNSTPSDKYKFFLKGTQLEQLDRDYRITYDFVDSTDAQCASYKEDISHKERKVKQAEEKKKQMDSVETLRQRIHHLEWQHAWAQVEVMEKQAEDAAREVEKAEAQLDRRRQEAQAKSEAYDSKNQNVEAAREVKADTEQELQPLKEQHEAIKEDFDRGRSGLGENTTQLRHIKADLKSAKDEVNKCKARIDEEEKRIEAASGPAQAEKLVELRAAEEDAAQKRAEMEQGNKQELERARQEAQDDEKSRVLNERPAQQRLDESETRLNRLQNDGGNVMKAYHRNMPQLLRAINNETSFQLKPVGPLGMHVRLKKPEWGPIVESIFGGVLEAFVVTSARDQTTLRRLQQKHSCPSDIYIGNPRPLDVTNQRADTIEDTLLTILEIDNDLARNQFIINQQAEQTVMIRSRAEASRLMASADKPRNMRTAVAMHDSIRGEGHRFAMTASGMKVDRIRPWIRDARMKTDSEAQIRHQKELVADARRNLDSVRQDIRQAKLKVKEASEAINRFDRRQRQLKIASQTADDRVEELKGELEQFNVEASTLDTYKAALTEAEETYNLHANSYTDAQVEKERINDGQKDIKRRLDQATAAVEEVEIKLKKLDAAMLKHDQARQTALREKNLAIGLVGEAETHRNEAEAAKSELETTVVEFTVAATEVHPRIEVEAGMTPDRIDAKITKLKEQRERTETAVGGSREEITEQWAKARDEWRQASIGLKENEATCSMLKKGLQKRKMRWHVFRKYITARAKILFTFLLKERGFQGRILCDHTNRMLDIAVEPDATQRSDKGRQAKTLSGGEKSFSTICLLLSIWEAMGSPIRCLDEFDVFMDNVNRDTSMKMMISAARAAVGKQYILITPQSMGNVPMNDDIRIHRMSDPERGQTTIDF